MDLRAFSVCRGCFEVYPSSRFCPHCATDGLAAPAVAEPAPAAPEVDDAGDLEPPRTGGIWLAGVAVAGLAVAVILAASAA